jgi:hypothetical protein
LLVPGVTPRLSRTPGHVGPLAPPLGNDTDAVRAATLAVPDAPDAPDAAWSEPIPSIDGAPAVPRR